MGRLHKILFIFFCFSVINKSLSQVKNKISLAKKLIQLEKQHNVVFSYNHTFLNTVFLENDFNCETLSNCITLIQTKIPVKFEKNNNQYIVIPERKNLSFNIIDNETKENVASITYQINKKPKQNLFLKNGVFTLNNIFLLDTIHIHSYFYKSKSIQAKNLLKIKTLKLYNKQFNLNEVILTSYITKGIDSKISDHSIQIKTESLGLLAGETDGDIFNVLSNIPGIHSPSGKSGNLNFRGNTYDQNLVQIDDIPIYHSGHFFGAISSYNTSVIDNIEVQRNMLPVNFGGRVGGLINMATNNSIADSTRYEVAINTLFAGATIKTNLIKNKLSLLAAYRSSYPGVKSPKLETISELIFQGSRLEPIATDINNSSNFNFNFSDMNAKLNYKINDKHSATLSFINIQNNLSAEIEENQNNNNQKDFRDLELDNWGVTAKWKVDFSDKLTTELRFSKSNMNLISVSEGFVLSERSNLEKYDNTISDNRLIADFNYSVNSNLTLKAGYNLTNHKLISNEVEEENNIDSERNQNGTIHSSYLSFQKKWNDKLHINFGFHNNYYSPLRTFFVNPRFSASYAINKVFYLKSSFGTSNQFIQKKLSNDFDDFSITNQLWFLPNNNVSPLKGTQGMFGAVLNKNKWLLDIELYTKKTKNITTKIGNDRGSISSFGADIFIKRKWHNIETWAGYSLSKTETKFNNVVTDAFFDQRHIINLTGLFNLNKWKFALSWRYFSGMPVILPEDTNIDSDAVSTLSNRFDGLHQLDFSTSFSFYNSSKTFKTVIGLSILNVYNQDNTVNIFQNTTQSTFRKTSDFSPNLQINLFF